MYVFSYGSVSERILKIGPHLPKLLSNINGTQCNNNNSNNTEVYLHKMRNNNVTSQICLALYGLARHCRQVGC